MEEFFLQHSLGSAQADAAACEVIRIYEEALPGQIAGYYVEGSYADQTQLPTSDLDMVLIFHQPLPDEQARARAENLYKVLDRASTLDIDITLTDAQELQAGVHPNLKPGGLCLYGEDICQRYPILPIEDWASERTHAAYWLLVNVYRRPIPVPSALAFPDPAAEFYGYANRGVQLAGGEWVPCTRNLVRTTGWVATALVALQAGQYVTKKRECVQLYRASIGDAWTSLLEDISTYCRHEWQYLIPKESAARLHLRAICERTLPFEQHFLTRYKEYVLAQLHARKPEEIRRALWMQQQCPLADEEVQFALQAAQHYFTE